MKDEKKSVLKARAKKLSQVTETKQLDQEFIEVLVFKLAKELYALETEYVKEIYAYKDYTALPGAPKFIFGLINIRRKIVSIFDLKVFFSLPIEEYSDRRLIILEDADMEFAILTDGIEGIQQIPIYHIQPSLPTLTGVKQDFVKGVADSITLLDGKKLLTSKRVIVNETVELET